VAAIEQTRIELLFQLLDLEGHRRLRHVKRFGGACERAQPRNGVKYLESAICHERDSDKQVLSAAFDH
jgi:hypothetical protein